MRPWQEFHFHQFQVKGLSPGKQETDHEYPARRLRATDWLFFIYYSMPRAMSNSRPGCSFKPNRAT
jgi:hypothetical protein